MKAIIHCTHSQTFFEIEYRNHVITSITRYEHRTPPEKVEYDDLSLSERETILLAIINHLNSNVY